MLFDRTISVHLDQFDGPLSLLLYLINREEMSLETLDLTQVTKQYLEFLSYMQEMDFDLAGEYLYLAATLVWLKCRLSVEEKLEIQEGEDFNPLQISSQEELIRRLKSLECFQQIGKKLWEDTEKLNDEIFVRPRLDRKKVFGQMLRSMDQNDLISQMIEVIKRDHRKFAMIRKDRLSIKEKLKDLCNRLEVGQRYLFSEIILDRQNIMDVVITFISLLELARLKKVTLLQAEHHSEIYVQVIIPLRDFNVDTATGFDEEEVLPEPIIKPATDGTDYAARNYQ